MTRMRIVLLIFLGIAMAVPDTYGQAFLDPRTAALGGSPAAVRDVRGFILNPAGLTGIKDWDVAGSTYLPAGPSASAFVFHGLSLGKRFLDQHVVALQYSPGENMRFVFAPELSVEEGNLPASTDREVEYDEPFAAGYAVAVTEDLSFGVDARFRREQVSETLYRIGLRNGASFPLVDRQAFTASSWDFDASMSWQPFRGVTLSGVGRNLARVRRGELGATRTIYELPHPVSAEVGAAFQMRPDLLLTGSVSTSVSASLGGEWMTGWGIALRGGAYLSSKESPALYAVGLGVGLAYQFFAVDINYLFFTNSADRNGTTSRESFDVSALTNLDANRYAQNRLSLSGRAIFGRIREKAVRIEGVEIGRGVYPAGAEAFAFEPLGKVRVKNTSSQPVDVTAGFVIDRFMDGPTESQPVQLMPGQEAEIPLLALFNDQLQTVSSLAVHEGNVFLHTSRSDEYDDRYQTRVVVYGKNDWDGSARSLRYFVRPDDPAVLRYSRDILLQYLDSLSSVPKELAPLAKARVLLNAFAGKLLYVSDPKKSADYVQYPSETLQIRGGDCDDMTVCFASLLSSIGISTAFVDVVPPDTPEANHIYLLFDTGLDPSRGPAISSNPKRYVVRNNKEGKPTIWIPIESTLVSRSFEEAWSSGAQSYFDEAEVKLGAVKGWVRVVDVY